MWFCQIGIDLRNLTNDPNQVWGKAGDLDLENEALGIQMAKRGNKPILVLGIFPYITGGSWVAWVGWALIVFFQAEERPLVQRFDGKVVVNNNFNSAFAEFANKKYDISVDECREILLIGRLRHSKTEARRRWTW